MDPRSDLMGPRHVANPLPSQSLPVPGFAAGIPIPSVDPGIGPEPVPEWAQQHQADGQQVIDYGPGWNDAEPTSNGLIPLGNGQYFNTATGQIQGAGGGNAQYKAL
jgi:hypothetical protein